MVIFGVVLVLVGDGIVGLFLELFVEYSFVHRGVVGDLVVEVSLVESCFMYWWCGGSCILVVEGVLMESYCLMLGCTLVLDLFILGVDVVSLLLELLVLWLWWLY